MHSNWVGCMLSRNQLCAFGLGVFLVFNVVFYNHAWAQYSQNGQYLKKILKSFNEQCPLAKVGVLVYDLDSKKIICAHNAKECFIPASVAKLFISAAYLDVMGPEFSFSTDVLAEGRIDDGVLYGNLILKGSGNPALRGEELKGLAMALKEATLKKIDGHIGVDASLFTPPGDEFFSRTEIFGDGWGSDKGAYAYMGRLSPLSIQYNNIEVRAKGGEKVGTKPDISLDPSTPTVINCAKTTVSGRSRLYLNFKKDGTIVVSGRIRKNHSSIFYQKIPAPEKFVGSLFRNYIKEAGVLVKGESIITYKKTPKEAVRIASLVSPDLPGILYSMNAYSNNTMAEEFLLILGAYIYGEPGTHAKGISALETYLHKVGIDKSNVKLYDAAGLSKLNKVTPLAIVKLLNYVYRNSDLFKGFYLSLASPVKDGTLFRRFRGNPLRSKIRGKTGTLRNVSTLAGYGKALNGHNIAFSILVNDCSKTHRAKQFEDKLLLALLVTGNVIL